MYFILIYFFVRELTDIDHMKKFIHVRYVDFSGNLITDLSPLNNLTHLIVLKADKNNLTTAELDPLPYLQVRFEYCCLAVC